MDIHRPERNRKRRIRRIAFMSIGFVLFCGVTVALFGYQAGPFKVNRDELWIGEVSAGGMLRSVRGIGTLQPDEIRWVASETSGRVERIVVLPGAWVTEDTVIMEMSNSELLQRVDATRLQLESERAKFISFKVNLQSEILLMKAALSQLEWDHEQAELEAQINTDLFKDGLESKLSMKRAQLRVKQLASQIDAEGKRLAFREEAVEAQVSAEESMIKQTEARLRMFERQYDNLSVKAGFTGVLQKQSVEVGQQVGPGTSLAQVANPKSLKAVLKVSEHQAKDVMIGLSVMIDTRNGEVEGTVARVDPNVVEGSVEVDIDLPEILPKGARPDLNIEGEIEIENIENTLYVERPAFARSNGTTSLFRFEGETMVATRVPVSYGRSGSSTIEVLSGLNVGDRVILSDTSSWDEYPQIQLK